MYKEMNEMVNKQKKRNGLLRFLAYGVTACAPLVFFGCAHPDQIELMEKRIDRLSAEQANARQEIGSLRNAFEGMTGMKSGQADIIARIDQIEAEIMRVNGQLEQMDHKNKQRDQEMMRFAKDAKERIDSLTLKVSPPSAEAGAAEGAQPVSAMEPGQPASVAALTTTPVVAPPVAAAQPAQPASASSPKALYEEGINLFRQGKFKEAKADFLRYVMENPNGALTDNAMFWVGDCEFQLGRFEESILEYQKVITKFPKGAKAPAAYLKQGMAFIKLGDKQSAKIIYEKLVKIYPNSEQATMAKKELSRLN